MCACAWGEMGEVQLAGCLDTMPRGLLYGVHDCFAKVQAQGEGVQASKRPIRMTMLHRCMNWELFHGYGLLAQNFVCHVWVWVALSVQHGGFGGVMLAQSLLSAGKFTWV